MTRDQDFKRLVRARMRETGENYTLARSHFENASRNSARNDAPHDEASADASADVRSSTAGATAHERAAAQQRRTIRPFLDAEGRGLLSIPTKRSTRMAVLLDLVRHFEPNREYTEAEVGAVLAPVHEDVAYLRRELVNVGYLTRSAGIYRLAGRVPERDVRWAHEFPEWERLWLSAYLAGAGGNPG